MSPMTKIFFLSGIVRSGFTKTRPALSVSTPSCLPSGEAATPVAHRTTSQSIHSSPTLTRPDSISVTKLLTLTSTPIDSSCLVALLERLGGYVPRMRSEPSKRITREFVVSIALKSFLQRLSGDVADRTGQFNTGRAAADNDKGQRIDRSVEICFAFREFESQQDPTPHLQRVFDRLKSGSGRFPIVVPEIRVPRSAGNDQIVILDPRAVAENDRVCGSIEIDSLAKYDLDVFCVVENPPDRLSDLTRA